MNKGRLLKNRQWCEDKIQEIVCNNSEGAFDPIVRIKSKADKNALKKLHCRIDSINKELGIEKEEITKEQMDYVARLRNLMNSPISTDKSGTMTIKNLDLGIMHDLGFTVQIDGKELHVNE